MTEPTTITKTVFFNASRQTVWSFLTDKDKLAQWFHRAGSDLRAGEQYGLVQTDANGQEKTLIWGAVRIMDPPSRLSYTFCIEPFNKAETLVTWVLEEAAGGTRLTLIHEGIAEATGPAAMGLLMALDHGWDQHLDGLRNALGTPGLLAPPGPRPICLKVNNV